jgi:hypothetical protein
MGVGSGLGGSVGIAVETTYGTYVAPTTFLEPDKAPFEKVKNTVQGGGLAGGRLVPLATRRVVTTAAGKGSLDMEVQNKSMGKLWAGIFGAAVAPVQQAATAAYLQTHTLVDNVGRYLTMQAGVPDTGGTVRPYTLLGCKIMSAEFECGVDQLLTCKLDIDAKDMTEAQTLAAPSYPTGVMPRHFGEGAVKIGATFGSEAAVTGVSKLQVKIDRKQKDDRYYFGNAVSAGGAGLTKSEPLVNDNVAISGSITADYVDKTIWADRFVSDVTFSLVWEFIGPIIASTYAETWRLTLSACKLDGTTPPLDGPDVVNGTFPFVALNDGVNPIAKLEYMSVDTTL